MNDDAAAAHDTLAELRAEWRISVAMKYTRRDTRSIFVEDAAAEYIAALERQLAAAEESVAYYKAYTAGLEAALELWNAASPPPADDAGSG